MTLAEYKQTLETEILKWFEKEKRQAPTNESQILLDRISNLIIRGGKRARPELLFLTYKAYGGTNPASLIDLGLALEFHHQFLLVHDDIIDNDTVRYGGPNIVGYYQQDKQNNYLYTPETMGLLAGDLLFSFSNQVLIDSKQYNEKLKASLLKMLNNVNASVVYGQQLDALNLNVSLSNFSEKKLLLIHSLKTASYSARLPMNCAAELLKLSSNERRKIAAFAEPFGILFQLLDDFSDYFTNASAFNNRPKYRDFRQGKITYPLYTALTLASKKEVNYLHRYLGNKDSSDEVMKKVVDVLDRCGAKAASLQHIEKFFTQAFSALDTLSIRSEQKQPFTKMLAKYQV